MDEEWDADNFQPKELPTATSISVNKWEGEDEDEDVKDNWEDEEEEEKKDVEKQEPVKPVQQPKKPKSKLQEKIEEKERKMLEEAERRAKVKPELTPEEILEEKLRQQKLQEESDLRVAMETFDPKPGRTLDPATEALVKQFYESDEVSHQIPGVGEPSAASGIDGMNPNTKEEFDELQQAISKKVQQYTKSQYFPIFAEDLIRNICVNLTSYDLKKLKITVENMFLEKSKAEKGEKAKSKKGKGKPKVKVEGENTLVHIGEYYDDYEDFM